MNSETKNQLSVRHYFVDEAGDGTLFDARGQVIVGREGCSHYFILGVLDVADPERLSRDLHDLLTTAALNDLPGDIG
jgi:hypothetical protein